MNVSFQIDITNKLDQSYDLFSFLKYLLYLLLLIVPSSIKIKKTIIINQQVTSSSTINNLQSSEVSFNIDENEMSSDESEEECDEEM